MNIGYKTYLFSYQHAGAQWSFEIPAKDAEDAKARLARLAYARLDGELVARLPATVGVFAWLLTNLRNLIKIRPPA